MPLSAYLLLFHKDILLENEVKWEVLKGMRWLSVGRAVWEGDCIISMDSRKAGYALVHNES